VVRHKQPADSTQPTQPRKKGAKPAQIPVPTREEFFRDLDKLAPRVEPPAEDEESDARAAGDES
jgi:hypothetical protein